jgi:hypothetical protein
MLFSPLGDPLSTKIFIITLQFSTEIVGKAYSEVKMIVGKIY